MALVDNNIRGSQGGSNIACDNDCDIGRNKKDEDRQRNTEQRSHGLWKEGMGTCRHDDQHLGYIMSEGAQRIKRQAISCGGTNILRSGPDVPDRTGRLEDKTKGRTREHNEGDEM